MESNELTQEVQEIAEPTTSKWSEIMKHTVYITSNPIREQLRLRYAFFTPPRSGLLNVVLDSFIPNLMYKAHMSPLSIPNIYKVPKTAVTISPWFASILGVKQVPLSDLIAILGYTEKDIRQMFKVVRSKKLHLKLIGYGGTNVNTVTWLSELSKLTNAPQLFESIEIYEPDSLEVSNLFRFPLDPRQTNNNYRIDTFASGINKTDLVNESIYRLTPKIQILQHYYTATYTTSNTITYGAPDIATRAELSKYGNFISATHSDKTCRIDLNPKQTTALQVESYGVIALATFFMNQLQMAISFIELLASNQDLQEQDKTILEYSFNGKAKGKPSRSYSFQLNHTGLLAQEEVE